jgi:predicted glycosyltransferase
LILATVTNFAPDVLIVDKKPRGVSGELGPTLDYLRSKT